MIRNVTCKTTPVSRSSGGRTISAVAGAAYRAGENLKGLGQGPDGSDKLFRYSGRSVVVREAFIMAPEDAPTCSDDRQDLWNAVEAMETRKNARLGREVQLGLAWELDHDRQRELVREFAQREFVDKGFIVDIAIHNYGRTLPAIGGTEEQTERIRELAAEHPMMEREDTQGVSDPHLLILRNRDGDVTGYKLYQPHAHIRVTPRIVDNREFVSDKNASRELNKAETAMRWRYEWPKLQNAYLERAGADVRVSSTSVEEDEFPNIPRLGTSEDKQLHAIEERREALDEKAQAAHEEAKQVEAIDREFREQHNDTLRQAFTEAHEDSTDSHEALERRQVRLTVWWRNMSQRFNEWRFEFREKAAEWRQHFSNQEEKLRSLIGWHRPEEPDTSGSGRTPPEEPQADPPPGQEPNQ